MAWLAQPGHKGRGAFGGPLVPRVLRVRMGGGCLQLAATVWQPQYAEVANPMGYAAGMGGSGGGDGGGGDGSFNYLQQHWP